MHAFPGNHTSRNPIFHLSTYAKQKWKENHSKETAAPGELQIPLRARRWAFRESAPSLLNS